MIKPIRNHENYQEALSQVETFWGADQDTPNGDQLDILLVLIEAYEAKNYPMPPSDPVDAIYFLMNQLNLTRKDLERFLGPKSRVSDVLNRKTSFNDASDCKSS